MRRKLALTRGIALALPLYLNRLTLLLTCVCAVSVLLYGVFLLEAVAHAASQTSAERKIQDLEATLGDLEAQYLAKSQSLTKEKALELGFVMPKEVTTVFATAAASALSLGEQ
jgi:hypothetical protein